MITAEIIEKLPRKCLHGLPKRKRQVGLYLMILKKDTRASVFCLTIMLFSTLKGINSGWTLRCITSVRLLLSKDWGHMPITTSGNSKGGQVDDQNN